MSQIGYIVLEESEIKFISCLQINDFNKSLRCELQLKRVMVKHLGQTI
jgi:hypothetical protein